MIRQYIGIFFTVCLCVVTQSSLGGGTYKSALKQCEILDGETVTRKAVNINHEYLDKCTDGTEGIANDVKNTIKMFWSDSFKDRYKLFSEYYKNILNNVYKIQNAEDYSKEFMPTERVWYKQTYESVKLYSDKGAQVTVLAYWEEEGYLGKMSFIFDMEKIDGKWKIFNIKK